MKYITTLLPALLLLNMASARPPHGYGTYTLCKEERKLNSLKRQGGINRVVITLNVPPNSHYIFYSVYASPKSPISDLKLHSQVKEHVKAHGFSMGLATNVLSSLIVPQGDGVVDVFPMALTEYAQNFEAGHDGPQYWKGFPESSRKNLSSGTISFPVIHKKTWQKIYLCIHNPSRVNAQFVTIEAVAIMDI